MAEEQPSEPAQQLVFISYSRANKDFASQLVADLRARGISCWFDQTHLETGDPDWEESIREAIRAARGVVLVASQESRRSVYVKAELGIARLYQRLIFPVWAEGREWVESIPMGLYTVQYVDARGEHYRQALAALVEIIARGEATLVPMAPALPPDFEPRNPYKGLRSFGEADAGDFFGRSALVADLIHRLEEALVGGADGTGRLLAMVGSSGSGKSSLVQAGLLPHLKAGALPGSEHWEYLPPLVPGSRPVEALALLLAGTLGRSVVAVQEDLADDSRRGLHRLASLLAAAPGQRVLLVVDQGEEVFTQGSQQAERQQFFDLLVTAATEPHGPVTVLLALRADFYHQLMPYADLWPLVQAQTAFVTPLSVDELREAIEAPAALPDVQVTFEGDLVGDMLFEVRGQEGALPLLQFTLDQLFAQRGPREHRLTEPAYQAIGRVQGALAQHAEETFAALPDDEHRRMAELLFVRLVEPGASEQDLSRRRATWDELALPDPARTRALRETAEAFVAARLLVAGAAGGATTIEVSHEALIRAWPRLQQWIATDRAGIILHRQLTLDALRWARAGQDKSLLYRGNELATAVAWRDQSDHASALNQIEQDFLLASLAQQAREEDEERVRQRRELEAAQALARSERRRATIARRLSSGLVLLLVVALAAVVLAVQQRNVAQSQKTQAIAARDAAQHAQATAVSAQHAAIQQRDLALSQERLARSRALAADAAAQLPVDPELSVLLASQALQVADTSQAEDALRQALATSSVRLRLDGHAGPVYGAAYSPDGTRLASANGDGTVRIWSAGNGRQLMVLHDPIVATVLRPAFSPDGRRVVAAIQRRGLFGPSAVAQVWDGASGHPLFALRWRTTWGNSAAFSPDGKTLITADSDDTIRLWDARTGSLLRTFPLVPSAAPASVAFSPDGRKIIVACSDDTARILDATTGATLQTLKGHTAALRGAAFSADGTKEVTASVDETVRVWNATGASLLTLYGAQSFVNSAAFSPDGRFVLAASGDGNAYVWDAQTGRLVQTLRGHTRNVNAAAYSPDGAWIMTASDDGTMRIWVASAEHDLLPPVAQAQQFSRALFSPDGTRLLTLSTTGAVTVWDARSGQALFMLPSILFTQNVAYTPDGKLIVTTGISPPIQLWNAADGRSIAVPPLGSGLSYATRIAFGDDGHSLVLTFLASGVGVLRTGAALYSFPDLHLRRLFIPPVSPADATTTADVSPDGSRVVTAGSPGAARIWDAQTGHSLLVLQGATGNAFSAAFSPDGTRVLLASFDGIARIWDARTGRFLLALRGAPNSLDSAAFSPDGSRVVTASTDGMARIWDARTGRLLLVLRGHTAPVRSAAFSPDGTRVVTASTDGSVRVWDARTGAPLLVVGPRGLWGAAVSPKGTQIVTAGADQTARIWDAHSGHLEQILRGHTGDVYAAAFSPDGTRVVTASADGTARVWDARTGRSLLVLRGHTAAVRDAAFSPDGRRVVTAGHDDVAIIWDARTGRRLGTLSGHTNWVNGAAFSPDGKEIVTASGDATARIWSATTQKPIVTLQGHTAAVFTATFSPDGTEVLTASSDGTARLWDARTGAELVVLSGHTQQVVDATFSPDGRFVVTASNDGTARVWDARTGQSLIVLGSGAAALWSAVFTPDGRHIVTTGSDGSVRIYPFDVGGIVADLLARAHAGDAEADARGAAAFRFAGSVMRSVDRVPSASSRFGRTAGERMPGQRKLRRVAANVPCAVPYILYNPTFARNRGPMPSLPVTRGKDVERQQAVARPVLDRWTLLPRRYTGTASPLARSGAPHMPLIRVKIGTRKIALCALLEVPGQIAGQLSNPGRSRVPPEASQEHLPRSDLDGEQHEDRMEEQSFHLEEIVGESCYR